MDKKYAMDILYIVLGFFFIIDAYRNLLANDLTSFWFMLYVVEILAGLALLIIRFLLIEERRDWLPWV